MRYQVKGNIVREVVNRLRDTALEFHEHGSLREHLARELEPLLVASRPAEVDDEIRKQGDTMAKWLRSMSVVQLPFSSWADTCYELSSKWTDLTAPSHTTNKEK